MKQLLLFLLILKVFGQEALAGSGGPDRFGYSWKDSNEPGGPVYSWWDITGSGTQVTGLKDDNVVGPFNMLQGFNFFWYQPQSFWIGTNGFISFNGGNLREPFNFHLNWIRGTKDYVAPFLTDLNFTGIGNMGRCFYLISGDSLCISWENVPFWNQSGFSGNNSFQIIFNRINHSITFNYKNVVTQIGMSPIAALTNYAGNLGFRLISGQAIPSNYSIRIDYPTNSSFIQPDLAVGFVGEQGSKATFANKNGASSKFKALIRNLGNVNAQNFSLEGKISFNGQVHPLGNISVPNLQFGKDTLVEFPVSWTGTQVGRHELSAEIIGFLIDSVSINNAQVSRVMVIDTSSGSIALAYNPGIRQYSFSSNNFIPPIAYASYFKPSFYPAKIVASRIYHQQYALALGVCNIKIYDDSGPNGTLGNLLDSVFIDTTQRVINRVNLHPVSKSDLVLHSGGVYLVVEFFGNTASLACDTLYPTSNRQFEIVDGVMSEFSNTQWCEMAIGLQIEGLPQQDLSLRRVVNPTPGWMPNGNAPVSVWIRNRGLASASGFQVAYRAGNQPVISATYTGAAIAPQDSVLFTFPQSFNTSGLIPDEVFCVWTEMAADSIPSNDTICFELQSGLSAQSSINGTLHVFPNPLRNGELLTLKIPESHLTQEWRMEILDISGRRQFQRILNQEVVSKGVGISVPLPNLSSGVYQVLLHQNGAIYRQSLVIQKD